MTVGDVVSGVFVTTSSYHYFQPSAGTEIVITFMGGRGTITYGGLYDGANSSLVQLSDGVDYANGHNTKCCINNAVHLVLYANTSAPSYSGMQTK